MNQEPEEQQIRVVIVDDEALVRSGFTRILEAAADIRVVGVSDGPGASAVIGESRPDVVLLDIRMPGRNGLEVLAELTAREGHPVVAILTTFDTDEHIAAALEAGAAGFLVKDTDPNQLPQLVRTLHGGGAVFSPEVSRTVVSGYLSRGGTESEAVGALSERERAVLVLLAKGATNSEIGASLHLSVGTVKSHVSSILGKLGVSTRVEAALAADRAGMLSDE